MDKTIARNAIVSAVVVAGLGFGGLAVAANAAESSAKADSDKAASSAKADTAKGASAKADSASADAAGAYKDGTYTAEGKGIGGKVPVTVTIEGGVITAVEVGDNSETPALGGKAIEQLPAKIVEANGIDGVDTFSGATITSKAIFTAVEDCLTQAQ